LSPPVATFEPYSHYRVGYLLADGGVELDNPIAPTRLASAMGARVVYRFADLLDLDRAVRFDAVFIHNSALGMVGHTWLINTYRRGTVIILFNVDLPQAATLLEDSRIGDMTGRASYDHVPLFYTSLAAYDDCASIPNNQGTPCGSYFYAGRDAIAGGQRFTTFLKNLSLKLFRT
jgi:hypothetical protein